MNRHEYEKEKKGKERQDKIRKEMNRLEYEKEKKGKERKGKEGDPLSLSLST